MIQKSTFFVKIFTIFLFLGFQNFSLSAQTYCVPGSRSVDRITNVTLGTLLHNPTENVSYVDNTTGLTVPALAQGSANDFSLKARGLGRHFALVWMDFNNDGDFEDAGELVGKWVGNSNSNGNIIPTTVAFTLNIPANAPAGNHRMRVFWQYSTNTNDNYYDNQPCAANAYGQTRDYTINIVACGAPATQPTNLSLTQNSATRINGAFSASVPASTGYLVVRSVSSTLSANPVNFTAYTAGQSLGGGTVVASGASTTFSDTGLAVGTNYHYFVFAYNNTSCTGGIRYNTTAPLNGSTATSCLNTAAMVLNYAAATSAEIAWAAAGDYIVEYGPAGFTPGTGSNPGTNGTIASTNASASFLLTNLNPDTNYSVAIRLKCPLGGFSGNVSLNFKTLCRPTVTNVNTLYINSFQFVGTLKDHSGPNVSGASGYSNFTGLTPVVQQPQGSVLNVVTTAVGQDGLPKTAYWKAWVDWNKNGVFDTSEQVYEFINYHTESRTFGFVIPQNTAPGKYVLRIKISDKNALDACNSLTAGETEDYSFEVVADCTAKINTATLQDVQRCGTGSVTLTASGTGTGVRWYANATGGVPLHEGANFTTPEIAEDTSVTYYVVAFSGSCESAFRLPVRAIANHGPSVDFGTVPAFCDATANGKILTATSGKRQEVLFNETFNSGLGAFEQSAIESGNRDISNSYWTNRPSPYIPSVPPYAGLAPALSSGFNGGNFAMTNTDIDRKGNLLNRLTLKNSLDTRHFENLNIEFDLYYFTLITAQNAPNYFSVDYSTDGGSNWSTLQTFTENQGNPNIWKKVTIQLPSAALNATSFKLRFSSFSFATTASVNFKESIAAVDNVRIFGTKDESSLFAWSSTTSGILFEADCVTPLNSTKAASVCVKPTAAELENKSSFSISATANFTNGCPALGTVTIENNLKVWDNGTNAWSTNFWKPDGMPPDATKCVLIKQPVLIADDVNAFAKNIKIETGGGLDIFGNLTLTDELTNLAVPEKVMLEPGANIIQINGGNTINNGNITARQTINMSSGRQQYNYIISPLEGQSLKTIYPDIQYVLYHSEATNYFYNSSGAYIKGRALAVKEGTASSGRSEAVAVFSGYPTNGAFTYTIVNTNPSQDRRGFNLVGNPYPSNMDLFNLYTLKGGNTGALSSTFHFWDNRANSQTVQMGDNYGNQSYATFNVATPPGIGTGTSATGDKDLAGTHKPTNIVKIAQGFMVKTNVASLPLKFDNSIRTTARADEPFFGKKADTATAKVDRFWLNMITPANLAVNMAVVYFNGGNNDFSIDDSPASEGSDDLYSFAGNAKAVINGRAAFTKDDVLQLGSTHFVAGNYTIALEAKEGVFAEGQSIYLKDKKMGILTNLSETAYAFTENAGDFTGRFEIVYLPEIVLGTNSAPKDHVVVYKEGNDFVVKSANKKIISVDVFDMSGRLLITLSGNQNKLTIPAASLGNGAYVLKIKREDDAVTKKVIK